MTGALLESQPAMRRKIVHVDMDVFYASVEQRDDATLRGKPLIRVQSSGSRGISPGEKSPISSAISELVVGTQLKS